MTKKIYRKCQRCGAGKPRYALPPIIVNDCKFESTEWKLVKYKRLWICPDCLNNTTDQDEKELRKQFEDQNMFGSSGAECLIEEAAPKWTAQDKKNIRACADEMGFLKSHDQIKDEMFTFDRKRKNDNE